MPWGGDEVPVAGRYQKARESGEDLGPRWKPEPERPQEFHSSTINKEVPREPDFLVLPTLPQLTEEPEDGTRPWAGRLHLSVGLRCPLGSEGGTLHFLPHSTTRV